MPVDYKPEGYHTVTPYLTITGVPAVIDFAKAVFGAEEIVRMPGPDGRVMHAEIRIGDSMVMMGEAPNEAARMPAMLHLYVEDVDAAYQRALNAGGVAIREPADQFYGDRSGGVRDSAGNHWWIATHVEDVSGEEMERRMAAQGSGG